MKKEPLQINVTEHRLSDELTNGRAGCATCRNCNCNSNCGRSRAVPVPRPPQK